MSTRVIQLLTSTPRLFCELAVASRSEYSASGPSTTAMSTGASGTSYRRIA